MAWNKHEGCMYYTPQGATAFPNGTCSLAGFDLDSTLILSNNGGKYSKGIKDWIWAYPNIPETMQALRRAGWTIVLLSNRKGPPWELKHAQAKVKLIMEAFSFEFWVFFATGDAYRKPGTKMIELFANLGGIKTWGPGSFFCGDAAGPASPIPQHRWSDVDAAFAKAVGLTFYEPQERFGTWPSPDIAEATNLIITQGQMGSGWESFTPYVGQYIPLTGTARHLYIIDDIKMQSMMGPDPEKNKDGVVVVVGSHPTRASRDLIRSYYSATFKKEPISVVYWYAQPSADVRLSDKTYSNTFQAPTTEAYFRIN